jgi:CHAT domain-containing protein/Tfp pilus assembly protein PilF
MRGFVLALVAGFAGLLAVRADDPPKGKGLTPAERTELERKCLELKATADRAYLAGDFEGMEKALRECLGVTRRLHPDQDAAIVATSLHNLGFVLDARGRSAEAVSFHRDALAMQRRLSKGGDSSHVANSLNSLALALQADGRLADAEPLLREALDMRRRLSGGRDDRGVATTLGSLGIVLQDRGRLADAEAHLREALDMIRWLYKDRDHESAAVILNQLAGVLQRRGRLTDAETHFRDALEMMRRLTGGRDHPAVATCLSNQGSVLQDRGRPADAEGHFRDALAMSRRLHKDRDHPDVARGLVNLAGNLVRTRSAGAEPLYKEALRMYDRLASQYALAGSEGEALTLTASQPLARDLYLSNARLSRSDPSAVYAEVWASKAAVGRVAERRALAARAATDPRAVGLLADLRDARRRRAELLLAPRSADANTRDERERELDTLARTIQALDASVRPLLPAEDRLDKLARATPSDLRAALPADAVLADMLAYTHFERDPNVPGEAGEKRTPSYAAFVLTRDGVHRVELGPAEPIDAAVRLWREAITTAPDKEPLPDLPRAVRDRVWEPIRKALPAGVKVVYVAPDAALTGLPWAALPGDKPGTVLLEELAVAVVPHGPALLDALWPADPTRRRTTGLLAVGGVAYSDEPVREHGWSAVAALARSRTRGEVPTDPSKAPVWGDLPGARGEAEQVRARAATRGIGARLVTGPAASAERVLDELGAVGYAHLATHGFFADPQFRSAFRLDPKLFAFDRGGRERVGAGAANPMVMSGLVFAGANRPGTPGRGVLTGEALLDRDLSGLDLAVLSACETGLGDVADGQGVFGLQRAFHLAGCRNVVASLWKVNDDATAALMAEFYRRLWDEKAPLPPVEALRQAQLAVRHADPKDFKDMATRGPGKGEVKDPKITPEGGRPATGRTRNPPALWAAFVLSGPGR